MIEAAPGHGLADAPVGLLYHGASFNTDAIAQALESERIERRSIDELFRSEAEELPALLAVDSSLLKDVSMRLRGLPVHVVVVAVDQESENALGRAAAFTISLAGNTETALRTLRQAFQLASARLAAARAERELGRTRNELRELHRIGIALMTERDQNQLLRQILQQARRLTQSDAGSLYLTEKGKDGSLRLRFKLTENDSLPELPFVEHTLPLSPSSLAGYAASTRKSLTLGDAYEIPADASFALNRSFDQRCGYRTKSMLVVPMVDHRDDVVGVLQLINRKSLLTARITSEQAAHDYVLPYTDHERQLVQSLAGQAAISIENSQLYAQIENLFESFVKAAVTAIDQRDPTTAGHSIRVATLSTDLAQAVERAGSGPYRDTKFSRQQLRELRYAAMLHDFGKVAVREEVLVKSKKLPPVVWERVESRFDLIRRTIEAEFHKKRIEAIKSSAEPELTDKQLELEYARRMAELDKFQFAVRTANEPSVHYEEADRILLDIAQCSYRTPEGQVLPYLAPDELHFLQIPRGSLDERERVEIESHVEQTYRFLNQIPWTDDLRNLASYAYAHHERLNGLGYPRRLAAEEIPVQTRLMTIADIFDALTAADRPYKRSLPFDQALHIIEHEAREGSIDRELVQIMVESQVYRRVLEEDWREF